jgi:hypothetical protein
MQTRREISAIGKEERDQDSVPMSAKRIPRKKVENKKESTPLVVVVTVVVIRSRRKSWQAVFRIACDTMSRCRRQTPPTR